MLFLYGHLNRTGKRAGMKPYSSSELKRLVVVLVTCATPAFFIVPFCIAAYYSTEGWRQFGVILVINGLRFGLIFGVELLALVRFEPHPLPSSFNL